MLAATAWPTSESCQQPYYLACASEQQVCERLLIPVLGTNVGGYNAAPGDSTNSSRALIMGSANDPELVVWEKRVSLPWGLGRSSDSPLGTAVSHEG